MVNETFPKSFFDEASAEWRANKVVRPGGTFAYRCGYTHSSGKPCKRPCQSYTRPHPYRSPESAMFYKPPSRYGDLFCKQHRIRGPVQAGLL